MDKIKYLHYFTDGTDVYYYISCCEHVVCVGDDKVSAYGEIGQQLTDALEAGYTIIPVMDKITRTDKTVMFHLEKRA